jgi:hypothetical protein
MGLPPLPLLTTADRRRASFVWFDCNHEQLANTPIRNWYTDLRSRDPISSY